MKIWLVELEGYDFRYTKQWSKWFPNELTELKIEHEIIEGKTLTKTIEKGSVLDACGTNYYKSTQLQEISLKFKHNEIKDGDVFLLYDGWFPGVEMIKYMSQLLGIKTYIYSIFHAGTYDEHDFTSKAGMRKWAKGLEFNWFNKFYDGVFVATKFHKRKIERCNGVINKIHVTGLPYYPPENFNTPWSMRDNIIVFPHRLDKEKQPEFFDEFMKKVKEIDPSWIGIKTMEKKLTKEEYYNLLKRSKIIFSSSLQETWGIGTLEATSLGCLPILPNRLSYSEMYPNCFLYEKKNGVGSEVDNAIEIFKWINPLEDYKIPGIQSTLKHTYEQYKHSIEKMLKVIKEEHWEVY